MKKRRIKAESESAGRKPVPPRIQSYRSELILALTVVGLAVIRFAGWFQNADVPGWDAPGHFLLFSRMATDLLPHGHVMAYMTDWLGGISLFQFYAPLWFILSAGVWLLTFKLVPLALMFRLAAFITLLAVPVGLWVAAWAFFGRRAARWVIALAPIYLFFPRLYSSLGPGGGGLFWVGLIPSAFGLAVFLMALASVEFWRKNQSSRFWPALFAVLVGALGCGHTVSLIIGTGLLGVYGLAHLRERGFLVKASVAYAVGIGLAAWWIVPFFADGYLTASEVRFSTGRSLLSYLFPVDFRLLGVFVALVIALVVGGLVAAWRDKRRDWPLMTLAVTAVMVTRILWVRLFPDFTMHYERFAVFIYVLCWASAGYALAKMWDGWAADAPRRRAYLVVLVVAIGSAYLLAFDWKPTLDDPDESPLLPMQWTWEEYPAAGEGKAIVDFLGGQDDVQRVHAYVPRAEATYMLGAHQYFPVRLALLNRQESIVGMLMESSPLVPFFSLTVESFWGGEMHGDMRLALVDPFRLQPWEVQLQRMLHLGVSHVIVYRGTVTDKDLSRNGATVRLMETENFAVYRLEDVRPPAVSVRRPSCFFNADGSLQFRDFAFALWAGEKTFALPVIWVQERLSVAALDRVGCGAVIISARKLPESTAADIRGTGRKTVVIGGIGGDWNVPELEHIPRARKEPYVDWPAGWSELQTAILEANESIASGEAMEVSMGGEAMRLRGNGSGLVRYGFTSKWHPTGEGVVYMAAPALTYVSGDGDREFRYESGLDGKLGFVVSLASLIALLVWLAGGRRRRGASE